MQSDMNLGIFMNFVMMMLRLFLYCFHVVI